MPRSPKQDTEILEAALIGFQHLRDEVEQKIADLRSRIGTHSAMAGPAVKKRTMSAAARRRIGLAQKKRWAAYKTQPGGGAPKKQKRVLSAAGRARIIAATKKRWAAFRKARKAS
jgi:hypothetical protein